MLAGIGGARSAVCIGQETANVANQDQQAAIAEIEKLGGQVQVQRGLVVAVRFTAPRNLTDDSLVHLQGLTDLESLTLWFTKNITGEGVKKLKGLASLRELHMPFAISLADDGLAHLASLSQSESLDPTYADITDAGLIHLQVLT